MELWILVSGWEGKKMTDRKICMEDGTPLSEELIHIEKPEFELVQREQEIRMWNLRRRLSPTEKTCSADF